MSADRLRQAADHIGDVEVSEVSDAPPYVPNREQRATAALLRAVHEDFVCCCYMVGAELGCPWHSPDGPAPTVAAAMALADVILGGES